MIVLVSLIVLLRRLLVPTVFHMDWSIPTSAFIQQNDFYTCFTYFCEAIASTYTTPEMQ